jgi:glycogen debranching enzyme
VSQGVPMLQGGDELGRTQSGNNNAYCQDNSLTWLDWKNADAALIEFTASLIALRQRFPQLRRRHWLTGELNALGQHDIVWWHPDGREMLGSDWESPDPARHGQLGFVLGAEDAAPRLLVLLNRHDDAFRFRLPPGTWQQLCDSSAESAFAQSPRQDTCLLAARSVQLLSQE